MFPNQQQQHLHPASYLTLAINATPVATSEMPSPRPNYLIESSTGIDMAQFSSVASGNVLRSSSKLELVPKGYGNATGFSNNSMLQQDQQEPFLAVSAFVKPGFVSPSTMIQVKSPGTFTFDDNVEVARIISMPWMAESLGKRPRDMKRLDGNSWYVVCKVIQYGNAITVLLRSFSNPTTDFGFFKPPADFENHPFQQGDFVQLSQVGYSSARNRIATQIRIRPRNIDPSLFGIHPDMEIRTSFYQRNIAGTVSIDDSQLDDDTDAESAHDNYTDQSEGHLTPAPAEMNAYTKIIFDASTVATVSNMETEEMSHFLHILSMIWPKGSRQKPPCDMKRMRPEQWYVVCELASWGEKRALMLRSMDAPETDKGFFKPPERYETFPFEVGQCLQIQECGYSQKRNKVAKKIKIRPLAADFPAFHVIRAITADKDRQRDAEADEIMRRETNRIRQSKYREKKRVKLAAEFDNA